ncbi:MAG: DUF4910 domain-containing protein [Kiritimatiellae bacterium]|nr:DUF4910 domain-containing protein [Kiritimatiellia bacterium]
MSGSVPLPTGGTLGAELYRLCARLYPLFRSLTGEGVRATLAILRQVCDLQVRGLCSGEPILDWTVPLEWTVREAWLRSPSGELLADVRQHNLQLVGYSVPFRGHLDREALRPHLHSLPERPDWIPYRTSYWTRDWGFCLPHRRIERLEPGSYEVCVDTELAPGEMNWGERLLPGTLREEILITTHICHPSMANDNCSGMAIAAQLAAEFARAGGHRRTLRFLFAPGTVGAIAWLARHRELLPRIRHVIVLAGLGDPGPLSIKHTRRGDTELDAAALAVARSSGRTVVELPFAPYGYDERQYSSPGFDLPTIVVSRSPFGTYPEYHTSADNLDFIQSEALADSYLFVRELIRELDSARHPVNLRPFGEPQLGRRGLYASVGGDSHARERQMAMLWVLNLADGRATVDQIVRRSNLPQARVEEAIAALEQAGLLGWAEDGG